MPKWILFCIAAIILCLARPAVAQTVVDAGAWTEFYTYKVLNQDDTQIRSLQGLRFGAKNIGIPGLGFFIRGRVASDISHKLASDPDFRVFGAYAEYKRREQLSLRLGRQFVSAGVSGFTLDGGRIDLSPTGAFKLIGYAGGIPGPSFYDFDQITQWDQRNAFGGQLQYNGIKEFRPSVSYLQRNVSKDVESKIGGFDFTVKTGPYYEWVGINYDFFNDRFSSAVTRAGIEFEGGHRAEFEYFYRRPTFGASNVFSVFQNEPFHQVRVSPIYKINKNLFAQGSLSYTILDDDANTRMALGGSYKGQTLGAVYSDGYGGTRLGLYSFLYYDLLKQLRAYVNADMYNYKLDTGEDDTTPSVSVAFGALANIIDGIDSRAELQLLSNRDLKYDTRFYIKIGYNFNSRFRTSGFGGGLIR